MFDKEYSTQWVTEMKWLRNHGIKYSLGACVHPTIHNLFHKIYGSGGNTLEQWEIFCMDIHNKKYKIELTA